MTLDDEAQGREMSVVKTVALFGLLSLLLIAAHNKVAGGTGEAALGSNRPVDTQAPAAMVGSDHLPAGFSEYVFMHQARAESSPVHAMARVTSCPD